MQDNPSFYIDSAMSRLLANLDQCKVEIEGISDQLKDTHCRLVSDPRDFDAMAKLCEQIQSVIWIHKEATQSNLYVYSDLYEAYRLACNFMA